jgi:hypothetical protein
MKIGLFLITKDIFEAQAKRKGYFNWAKIALVIHLMRIGSNSLSKWKVLLTHLTLY